MVGRLCVLALEVAPWERFDRLLEVTQVLLLIIIVAVLLMIRNDLNQGRAK